MLSTMERAKRSLCTSLGRKGASLVAQPVKNPPAMQVTWVPSLDWEDPLEEYIAAHSSILAWRIPMDRRAWRAIVHDVTKSQTQLRDLSTVGRELTPAPKEQPCQINQIQI